jgi:hypothetical protein
MRKTILTKVPIVVLMSVLFFLTCNLEKTTETPPTAPSGPFPVSGSVDIALKYTRLDWADAVSDSGGAVTYDLYIGLGSLPAAAAAEGLTESAWSIPESFLSAGTYYWSVAAKDAEGNKTTGPTWTFIVTDGSQVFGDWTARMPDANLRSALESVLGKQFGAITYGDLGNRTNWRLKTKSIANLTGIEYCTGAKSLHIGDNSITDLTPLTKITGLTSIWAGSNNISDITPLLVLPALQNIGVPNNPLDYSALSIIKPANFPNLTSITFDGREESTSDYVVTAAQAIDLLSPYKSNLKEIGLYFFQMGDTVFETLYNDIISINAGLYTRLEIGDCQLTDASLTLINNMMELKQLSVWGNQFTDLTPITGLTKLNTAHFSGNQLTSLTPIQDLYDAGAFRQTDAYINLKDNGLDLTTGSPDRIIVDNLIAGGVTVDYIDGNTVE